MDEILRPKVRLAGEWFFRHQPLLFAPLLSGGRNGGTNAGRSDTSGRGLHVPCCRSCIYCPHSIAVAGLMFFNREYRDILDDLDRFDGSDVHA